MGRRGSSSVGKGRVRGSLDSRKDGLNFGQKTWVAVPFPWLFGRNQRTGYSGLMAEEGCFGGSLSQTPEPGREDVRPRNPAPRTRVDLIRVPSLEHSTRTRIILMCWVSCLADSEPSLFLLLHYLDKQVRSTSSRTKSETTSFLT